MAGPKGRMSIFKALRFDLRGFRAPLLARRTLRDDLDRSAGAKLPDVLQRSHAGGTSGVGALGALDSKLIEPLFAIDRRNHRSRRWNRSRSASGPRSKFPVWARAIRTFSRVSVQAGYFFTPNWSLEVATGFPIWATVTINGYSPAGPPSGTALGKLMPSCSADNRCLSLHPVRRIPALSGGRDRTDLRLWRSGTAIAPDSHTNTRSASSFRAASITCSTSTGASLSMRSRAL